MNFARVDRPTPQAGFVETRLGRVHVRRMGSGAAVLLFHINRQSSELYRELMEALSPRFTAIAMDYPSYGGSEHLQVQPSIQDYAECGVAVLDAFGLSKAIVLGEAVGSAVATAFAGSYSERCAGVVLINVPLTSDRDSDSSFIAQVRKAASDAANEDEFVTIDAFLAKNARHSPLAPTRDWLDRVRTAHAQCGTDRWQAADALLDFDLKTALAKIDLPATLLTGAFSPFADSRAEVESRVPGIVSHVVPESRFAIGWEKATEVARHIGDLVDRS